MKTELEEAERREAEIQEEKETITNDCKLSTEKADELKVRFRFLHNIIFAFWRY